MKYLGRFPIENKTKNIMLVISYSVKNSYLIFVLFQIFDRKLTYSFRMYRTLWGLMPFESYPSSVKFLLNWERNVWKTRLIWTQKNTFFVSVKLSIFMNNKRMKNPMNSERNGSTICPSFEGGKMQTIWICIWPQDWQITIKQDWKLSVWKGSLKF